jgi:hypothetical protein
VVGMRCQRYRSHEFDAALCMFMVLVDRENSLQVKRNMATSLHFRTKFSKNVDMKDLGTLWMVPNLYYGFCTVC